MYVFVPPQRSSQRACLTSLWSKVYFSFFRAKKKIPQRSAKTDCRSDRWNGTQKGSKSELNCGPSNIARASVRLLFSMTTKKERNSRKNGSKRARNYRKGRCGSCSSGKRRWGRAKRGRIESRELRKILCFESSRSVISCKSDIYHALITAKATRAFPQRRFSLCLEACPCQREDRKGATRRSCLWCVVCIFRCSLTSR